MHTARFRDTLHEGLSKSKVFGTIMENKRPNQESVTWVVLDIIGAVVVHFSDDKLPVTIYNVLT